MDIQYTYLMYDGRHYKIGKSKNPETRLKELKTGNPKLILIAYGDGATETELLQMFNSKRIHGEFFQLSNSDVRYIRLKLSVKQYENKYKKEKQSKYNKLISKCKRYFFKSGKYKGRTLVSMDTEDEIMYLNMLSDSFRGSFMDTKREYGEMIHFYLINRNKFDKCDKSKTIRNDLLEKSTTSAERYKAWQENEFCPSKYYKLNG